jgi:GNAT superfamily N-acetyltransferase
VDQKPKKTSKRKNAKRVVVRQLKLSDYDAVCELQLKCFPGMKPWKQDQFESQISLFPEGQICIEMDGKIVASSSALVVDFDLYDEWQNWAVIADNGYIRNHDGTGNTMYGIEIMVDPDYRGLRLSRRLYDARKQIARDKNLERIIIGGRIPGYHRHAEELTAREYVDKVVAKELVDPVLTAQLANGFVLQRLIPDYLPVDKESMGYASFLEWANFDYRADRRRRWRAVEIVRVAVVQYQMRAVGSFEEFAQGLGYFVDVAADAQSDFVVFPELITTQLLGQYPGVRPGLAARKLDEHTHAFVEHFRQLAIRYNVNIVAGSHFTLEGGKLFNTGYLFHRDGRMRRQHKLHITPAERKCSTRTAAKSPFCSATTCSFRSSGASPPRRAHTSCSCLSTRTTAMATCECATARARAASRITYTPCFPDVPATCRSSKTRTRTTRSLACSRPTTTHSAEMASPGNARRMKKQ